MERITRAADALGLHMPRGLGRVVRYIAVGTLVLGLNPGLLHAATLSSAAVSLSTPVPSATSVTYDFRGTGIQSAVIKCIKVNFWANADGTGAIGNGFTAASATVNTGASTILNGANGSWTPSAAANQFTYANSGNTGAATQSSNAHFVLDGITNSSIGDTAYYYELNTYNNEDCTSSPLDTARVAFIFTAGSTLSLTIDNSLSFSVAGVTSGNDCAGSGTAASNDSNATTLPFGNVTSASNKFACQDLTAATNATNGYTIYARYSNAGDGKPRNALGNTIDDVSPGTNNDPDSFSAAGTEAYGYTTNDQSLSGSAGTGAGQASRFYNGTTYWWAAMTQSNAEIAFSANGVTSTTNRISHQVGVATTSDPGTYTTTIIYTCTPVY